VHKLAAVQVHHAGGDVVQHLEAARPRQVLRVPFLVFLFFLVCLCLCCLGVGECECGGD
jgi:hypothetical protein